MVPTLALSSDKQIKDLAANTLSIQWASSLLQDMHTFIASCHENQLTMCLYTIPQFWCVMVGLVVTNIPGVALEKKEVILMEELIWSTDGPQRKYINNNSFSPHQFHDYENCQCAEFLAFYQLVQYWRAGCQTFTLDFQGESCFQWAITTADNIAGRWYTPNRFSDHHPSVWDLLPLLAYIFTYIT